MYHALVAALDEHIPTLLAGGVPRFLPALIADAIAQGQHRIHVGPLPAHAAAFQAGLNHELVGTLHHPRTNRPTCASKERILHQGEPFAQIGDVLTNRFLVDFALGQAICHPHQGTWAAMFEHMQTAFKHPCRKHVPRALKASNSWLRCSAACGKSRMRIASRAMDVHQGLQPVRSIHHRTDLFGLDHLAPACLHFCQIRKVGSIRQAGEIREVSTWTCSGSAELSRNLSDGQRADFCPFSPGQGNHGSIGADGQARGFSRAAASSFQGSLGFGGLLFLDLFADFFAEPTGCFWADGDPQQIFEDPARMAKRHPTSQLNEMALLPGARVPGRKANSSSRGEKTLPTARAGSIGAKQGHACSSIAL